MTILKDFIVRRRAPDEDLNYCHEVPDQKHSWAILPNYGHPVCEVCGVIDDPADHED